MITKTLALLVLICFGCFGFCFTNSANSASKSYSITTLLDAKWAQTPLYMEMSEYLADENPNLYWDFLNIISEMETPLADIKIASKQYLKSINVIQKLLSTSQLSLLKLVVSMHSLTPRIQTHFQAALDVRSKRNCVDINFVTVGRDILCSLEEMKAKLRDSLDTTSIETYNFDHIYPGSENNSKVVILYGDIGSKQFSQYHKYLILEAIKGNVKYLNRHFTSIIPENKVRLSGYGVELHLKSTEYKSQDDSPKQQDESNENIEFGENEVEGFNFSVLKKRFPEISHLLDQFRISLLQKNEEITLLKAWEFQDLGLHAAQRATEIQGEEALHIMQFTAQNFPTQAKSLMHVKISNNLREEIKHNTEIFERSLNIVPPNGALFVNGLFYDYESLDLNSLVETLRSDIRVLENLYTNKIRGRTASSLLALDLSSSTKEFAIDIRDSAILWINCIENDIQYKRWPSRFSDLLRPTFPGMIRHIRKNVFNLVLVIDPLNSNCRNITKLVESFVIHLAPVRVGLVFAMADNVSEDDHREIFCAFNYVTQKLGSRSALGFLTDIFAAVNTEYLSRKHIKLQLQNTFKTLTSSKIDDILGDESDYDYGRALAKEFVSRLGFKKVPVALFNGVPMSQSILNPEDFEDAVFAEIMQQTLALQKNVYSEELKEGDDAIDYLMNKPHVMPRLNQRILSNEDSKFLDFTGTAFQDINNVRLLEKLSNRDMTATLMDNIRYFTAKKSGEKISNTYVHFLTLWIFADLDEKDGKTLLSNALKYMKTSHSIRVAFIPNVEGTRISNKNNLNRLVWAVSQALPPSDATNLTLKWLSSNPQSLDISDKVKELISSTELHTKILRVYCQRVLNIKKSERLVLANGKIFGPLENTEEFSIEEFGLIDRITSHQYRDKIRNILLSTNEDGFEITSDTLLKMYATLIPREAKTRFNIPADIKDNHSVVKLLPKFDNLPCFNIAAVIDPASRAAQKLLPVLVLLRNVINCELRVYLCPLTQHSDMPVKNFYRFVIQPEVQFTPNGKFFDDPIAKFMGMPTTPLLTQTLQVPENWLVEVVRSVYDLDNIKLSEIGGPVHSEFELEYLLLEGHCYDSISGAPPRGLQVTLGTSKNPTKVDTIVMANLGYFQLKANPGVWDLRLREGKSADIYEIINAEGPNTVHVHNSTRVMISSLRSHVIKLRVAKKPLMINTDLLGDDEENAPSRIWNKITSSFGGFSDDKLTEIDTINVFSVASGHLYERLLRIMMISLIKHTKSSVKFWFLKNYLSPQFTDFLPDMAHEYNFQYELVQYKWPRWLHQQTEKQRTIWGYKILFLDVLFPLNIRKIIFVDADAIVRADIKELYDFDLNGAPYAYTPFCDSRKEMEGFRFWKQGYWRSHLMGRRYHISALYVVDLKKFRKIAAGDRLRGQYQALSQDPNSLSNLDQDLPNNMIHQVAIKSLPDEWLWCETWCSDESFKYAKVIDLCNNPQTKEAKLTAAQRIVPEWKDYDIEIKKLMTKVEEHEILEHHEKTQEMKNITFENVSDGPHVYSNHEEL